MNTKRVFDARPDTADFRDLLYRPGMHEIPSSISLTNYKKRKVPILNQEEEGACVGYGLATVANFLLRTRKRGGRKPGYSVSPRMLYELARQYDEWVGTDDEDVGSSCRGAIKAWHKHGVCKAQYWPDNDHVGHELTPARAKDAAMRPLGTYYRVNPNSLNDIHAALAEVGILFCSAAVHEGWQDVSEDGVIEDDDNYTGYHAFAMIAYNKDGFWIQNSWGKNWGKDGFGLIPYEQWLRDGQDAWICRLGVPVRVTKKRGK